MISFIVDLPRRSPSYRKVVYALSEIGLRLNTKFAIFNDEAVAPSTSIKIRYGENESKKFLGLNLPFGKGTKIGHLVDGKVSLWGQQTDRGVDCVSGVANLLLFNHEVQAVNAKLDNKGVLPAKEHPLVKLGLSTKPLVENNVQYIQRLLNKKGYHWKRGPSVWGKKTCVILTHDVDGPQLHTPFDLARAFAKFLFKNNKFEANSAWHGLLTLMLKAKDPYWRFDDFMKIEAAIGAKSTFFVYPGPIKHVPTHINDPHYNPSKHPFPEMLKRLANDGWEIGAHYGINDHSTKDFEAVKLKLEELSNSKLFGSRAHYWAKCWKNPMSDWQAMCDAGFHYDTSCSNQALGFRSGTTYPTTPSLFWQDTCKKPFVVFPTAVMDAYLHHRWGAASSAEVSIELENVIKNTQDNCGALVLDWHVRSLANVGVYEGMATPLFLTLKRLLENSDTIFLTGIEATQQWQQHIEKNVLERPYFV